MSDFASNFPAFDFLSSGEDLGYRDDGEEAWNRYTLNHTNTLAPFISVQFFPRQESSEDEYEEDASTAKKLGMIMDKKKVTEEKKPSGIQAIFLLVMILDHPA